MTLAEREVMDAILSHQIDLFRLDAAVRARVLVLLDSLGQDLETKLARHGITEYQKSSFARLLTDVTKTVDSYYATIHGEVNDTLRAVAKNQIQMFATLSPILDVALPTERVINRMMDDTTVLGAPSADWWSRQAGDVAFRFSTEVRQGLLAGEDRGKIVARVQDAMTVSASNAEALVRTSIQSVAAEARMETYTTNSDVVQGVRQVSTLDGRTTDICIAYSDGEWTLDGDPMNGTDLPFDGGPPRHWNCRSVLVPIVDTTSALGFDISGGSTRAAEGGAVDAGTSFGDFLSRRSVAQQNEQLGVGRAQLWRDGKITLSQLLNQSGNPLTLAQLESKYGTGAGS